MSSTNNIVGSREEAVRQVRELQQFPRIRTGQRQPSQDILEARYVDDEVRGMRVRDVDLPANNEYARAASSASRVVIPAKAPTFLRRQPIVSHRWKSNEQELRLVDLLRSDQTRGKTVDLNPRIQKNTQFGMDRIMAPVVIKPKPTLRKDLLSTYI